VNLRLDAARIQAVAERRLIAIRAADVADLRDGFDR